jgi:hypothetical protein
MRLSVFIVIVFTAILSIENHAKAQNYPWCIYKPGDESPQCWYAILEQCLADRLGKGGSCSPNPYTSSGSPPSTRLPRR